MENQLKKQLLQNYLQQQNNLTPSVAGSVAQDENLVVVYNDAPENITLEEFKNFVKKWLEYDNFIKKAQEVIRDKRKTRDKISEIITKFMIKYNIDDLNTKEGRIRCKTTYKKVPANKKEVEKRITDYFQCDPNKKQEIISKIFEEKERVEKVGLRRLKIS